MSRTLPPFDPNFKFEDSLILGLVKLLELDWFQFLNDTQRAAWRTHWLTVSPMDIKRHVYTTGTASATGETHVAEERCYAWSQIYGVQRLQRAPVKTPGTTGLVLPSVTALALSPDVFAITYDYTASGLTTCDVIVFADGPANPGPDGSLKNPVTVSKGGRAGLRPMCAMKQQPISGTLDFWPCWHHRYGSADPFSVTATLAAVDVDNQLCPSLDLLTEVCPAR